MKNISGFTIVELLVVIVVGGILSAVVFVAYSGIQENARGAKAVSAIDSIEKAMRLYVAENGKYPEPTDITTPQNNTFICIQPNPNGWVQAGGLTSTQCGPSSADPAEAAYAYSPAVIAALKTKISSIPDTSDLMIESGGSALRGVQYVYFSGPRPDIELPRGLAYLMYYVTGDQPCGRSVKTLEVNGDTHFTACGLRLD